MSGQRVRSACRAGCMRCQVAAQRGTGVVSWSVDLPTTLMYHCDKLCVYGVVQPHNVARNDTVLLYVPCMMKIN